MTLALNEKIPTFVCVNDYKTPNRFLYMKQILKFLRQLQANNTKEWFEAHKDEYKAIKAKVDALAAELIARIGEYDETVRGLTPKDCTYRIYRDVRFSKDKSPYKTHIGIYICRGGKKSGYSGYYFHIGTGEGDSYPGMHMMAAGDYCADPKALKIIREDIEFEADSFLSMVESMKKEGFVLDDEYKLKRVPQGFSPDSPMADYLKYKVYCVVRSMDNDYLLQPNLAERVARDFRVTKPLLDFVNRAIEFAGEK